MTEIEEQLRRHAAATADAQRPVELGEITARKRHRVTRRGFVALAAAVGVVAVVGGVVAVNRDHSRRIVVAPGPSSTTIASTADCAAASLVVTSKSNERLHPDWLPAGFVLTQGSETALGTTGGLMYSTPVNGDRPYIEMARYHSNVPLDQLVSGSHSPVTVNGHAGIFNIGVPLPKWTAFAWTQAPGTALIVTGYEMSRADLLRVAESVQYESGSPFTYPTHPAIKVTRAQAVAALGPLHGHTSQSALTSYGELTAVENAGTSSEPAHGAGLPVTRPVWVAWVASGLQSDPPPDNAVVVDAASSETIERRAVHGGVLDHLTDRSDGTCAPPFGVLTRSEASYLSPPRPGATMIMKLTTQGALEATPTLGVDLQCALHACDPSVPAWLLIQTASDDRLNDRGIARGPANTQPGSWSVSTLDARTGPQSSDLGGFTESSGEPPADVLAVKDLAPAP